MRGIFIGSNIMTVYGIMEYTNFPYYKEESYLHNPLYKEKWRAEEEKEGLERLGYKYTEYEIVEYEVE